MKILELPTYVTIKDLPEFFRRKSGYGYMTWDITKSIANKKELEIDLLTKFNFTRGLKYENVNILENSWEKILLNFKFKDLAKALSLIVRDQISFAKIPYIFFYYFSNGYLEKILDSKKYDIVHIHGVGYFSEPIIRLCEKKQIKYIVTLHGLNSFQNGKKFPLKEGLIEKSFLSQVENKNQFVTVVSSGVKKTILDFLGVSISPNFVTITNGCSTNISKTNASINIRELYDLRSDIKIMLCVGRIDSNKNQIEIIKAYQQLDSPTKDNIAILFIGADGTNGEFIKALDQSKNKHLVHCGYVQKDDLESYYSQSDFNIVASKKEGFGLSIIEGYVHGLPCVTFSDLDAVEDLYNEKSMELVEERSVHGLSNGMRNVYLKNWDRDFIKLYSNNFSLKRMAENYLDLFRVIKEKAN